MGDSVSLGIHESQSRFWENVIGRSKPFWRCYYPDLKKAFPRQFKNVRLPDFYAAVNLVRPRSSAWRRTRSRTACTSC